MNPLLRAWASPSRVSAASIAAAVGVGSREAKELAVAVARRVPATVHDRASDIAWWVFVAGFAFWIAAMFRWFAVAIAAGAAVAPLYLVFSRMGLLRERRPVRDEIARCLEAPACFWCGYDLRGAFDRHRDGALACPECGRIDPRSVAGTHAKEATDGDA